MTGAGHEYAARRGSPPRPRWQAAAAVEPRPVPSDEPSGLAEAVETVKRFTPRDRIQAQHRRRLLAFAARHPDALHRSCETGHLTASAWVVNHDATRGLVLLHAKIGRWLQPGGHADGEPTLWGVALREATEEIGIGGLEVWTEPIDVDVHLFVNRRDREPSHLHFDVRYVVRSPPGASPLGNHESDALRWISSDQLTDADLGLDASTRRLARYGFSVARAVHRSNRPANG
ncbi:NUDIX hydrolase [Candidatus Poriferisodalis sp.]|uniref:NUDIX hydrolase n=1 Tax=Candidatus Poriferisodalis sp. TaxID=3101277 RepID=UPI003B01F7E7